MYKIKIIKLCRLLKDAKDRDNNMTGKNPWDTKVSNLKFITTFIYILSYKFVCISHFIYFYSK